MIDLFIHDVLPGDTFDGTSYAFPAYDPYKKEFGTCFVLSVSRSSSHELYTLVILCSQGIKYMSFGHGQKLLNVVKRH